MRVLNLCYHAVSRDWPAPLSVHPDKLEAQIEGLLDRGYRATTFTQAVLAPPSPRTLAVTFDDAFSSVAEMAAPILERLGVPATLFVPTDFPERGSVSWPGIDHWADGPHDHELRCLDWSEIADLQSIGWEIGAHTVGHPRLPLLDDDRLVEELTESRERCEERLGTRCMSVAYPYGAVDARVAEAARDAGYLAGAALSRPWQGSSDPLRAPRLGVYRRDDGRRLAVKMATTVMRVPRARPLPASRTAATR